MVSLCPLGWVHLILCLDQHQFVTIAKVGRFGWDMVGVGDNFLTGLVQCWDSYSEEAMVGSVVAGVGRGCG